MQSTRLLSRLVARNPTLKRSYHWHHRQQTMNDLPTPHGDFFEAASKKSARYNAILGVGVLTAAITLYVAHESTDLLVLNYSPPETYE